MAVTVGDWFVVLNRATGLQAPEEGGAHPMLVGSAWPGPRALLLPRSASVAEGRAHPAHLGACGSERCRLDKEGWISMEPISIDLSELTEFSCREPDEDVTEWAMGVDDGEARRRPRCRGRRR